MGGDRKPRLLITGTMSRADIVSMFECLRESCDLTFVEYERDCGYGIDRAVYRNLGELATWESFRSANALLSAAKPDKVVLLFTASLNQIALRAAAKTREIETIHVEHGYRLRAADTPYVPERSVNPDVRSLSSWRTHAFFAASVAASPPSTAIRLARLAAAVKRFGVTSAVLRAFADLRRTDRYVSYSRECFEYHREVDCISSEQERMTIFTGVPQFDDFRIGDRAPRGPELLLIDHQFATAQMFGWNLEFRRDWVKRVADAVFAAGFERLYVKSHPADRSGAWAPLLGDGVQAVERAELPELARRLSAVLGTFSTLQMPFAAIPDVAMISLEIHPEPGWFPSLRFVEAGVCEPVRSYEALATQLGRVDDLAAKQNGAKPAFTERFLHRLDGHATRRMTSALTSQ